MIKSKRFDQGEALRKSKTLLLNGHHDDFLATIFALQKNIENRAPELDAKLIRQLSDLRTCVSAAQQGLQDAYGDHGRQLSQQRMDFVTRRYRRV